MKVRMKVAMSGSRNGRRWPPPGEELDLPDDEAAGYCSAGLAEPVAKKDEAKVEKAVAADDAEKRDTKSDAQNSEQPDSSKIKRKS